MNNTIDGLPTSYDYNYVLKTDKACGLCRKKLTVEDIESYSVLCTESFDFFHKKCIEYAGLEPVFTKPKDRTSMIQIKKTNDD